MKKAVELEKELREIGEEIAKIVFEINARHPDYYEDNVDFFRYIKEYKRVFELLYEESASEGYYWALCSSEVYKLTFENRMINFCEDNLGAESEDFEEQESELISNQEASILLEENSIYKKEKYVNLSFVYDEYIKEIWLDKRMKKDVQEKLMHLGSLVGKAVEDYDDSSQEKMRKCKYLNLSLVEWGMVFYYKDMACIYKDYKTQTDKMDFFIKKFKLNCQVKTFNSRCAEAKAKIEKLEGRSVKSLDYTLKHLKNIAPVMEKCKIAEKTYKMDMAHIQGVRSDVEEGY